MKTLNKVLCGIALGVGALFGLMFLLDLILGIPFGRLSLITDILVVAAAGMILWQGLETWLQLK